MSTKDNITDRLHAICREHALEISGMRERQVIQAIVEAFASGDFEMHIAVGEGGSASNVTYAPYAGVERLRSENKELKRQLAEVRKAIGL